MGTGFTAAGDRGLFTVRYGGYVEVAREGDLLHVDSGTGIDLRTVDDGWGHFAASFARG